MTVSTYNPINFRVNIVIITCCKNYRIFISILNYYLLIINILLQIPFWIREINLLEKT